MRIIKGLIGPIVVVAAAVLIGSMSTATYDYMSGDSQITDEELVAIAGPEILQAAGVPEEFQHAFDVTVETWHGSGKDLIQLCIKADPERSTAILEKYQMPFVGQCKFVRIYHNTGTNEERAISIKINARGLGVRLKKVFFEADQPTAVCEPGTTLGQADKIGCVLPSQ